MTLRYLEKFTSADGTISYTFPLYKAEWESRQTLRLPSQQLVGASYAYDSLGFGVATSELATETIRGLIVAATSALAEAEYDSMASKCVLSGRGKIYVLNSDGTRRWAWGRLQAMPDIRVEQRRSLSGIIPYILRFQRYSHWFSTTLTTVIETVTATGETWTVANPGNLPADLVTIRLRANAAAGITNPVVTNQANGYFFGTSRDSASANSEIRLRTEEGIVDFSDTDGASYADDFVNYTLPTSLPALAFRVQPGNNTFQYVGGGTVNLDVEVSFYAVFA